MAPHTCAIDAHIPKNADLTTPYFTDEYWKHPANAAINEFAPGVPFGAPFCSVYTAVPRHLPH